MKNYYIQTIVLLFVVLAGFTSKSNAQFSSSETVYCYQYVKTDDNGVSSKVDRFEIIFVNFQKDLMGYTTVRKAKDAGLKLQQDADFYKDKTLEHLALQWRNWNLSYSQDEIFERFFRNASKYGNTMHEVEAYHYNSSYSSSNKYTYQLCKKRFKTNGSYYTHPYELDENTIHFTNGTCYTFSSDRSQLIIWKPQNTNVRHYYKLIDSNSLKPNLDFLD